MHNYRVWTGWIFALMLLSASSAVAQQAPQQNAPTAPSAPGAPAAPAAVTQPQQAYPAQPQAYPTQPQQGYPAQQQAYPAQPQAYPVQGGYPPAQGYPPPQQGYGQQQPYYSQQPYVTTGTAPRPRRPKKGLMIAGLSVLGGSYLIATSVGVGLIDEDDHDCNDCNAVARWLFVPVLGPWIAMKETDADGGLWLLGLIEVVGAGLTIGGIIRYVNTKRQYEAGLASWDFDKGRKLTLDMSSTPLLAGPRMKLQF
jgi:hypothetical protein